MIPQRDESGKVVLKCNRCGYVLDTREGQSLVIKKEITHSVRDKIIVIEGKQPKVLPTTKAFCPKCGNNTAYYWMIQTRAGDEPPTRFFKCTKCGHVWREYD